MVLTEKEMNVIKDLQTQEQSCVEKYKKYGEQAKDQELKNLFGRLQKEEQKHLDSLGQVLTDRFPPVTAMIQMERTMSRKHLIPSLATRKTKSLTASSQQTVSERKSWYLPSITQMFLILETRNSENFWQISRSRSRTMRRCSTNTKRQTECHRKKPILTMNPECSILVMLIGGFIVRRKQ